MELTAPGYKVHDLSYQMVKKSTNLPNLTKYLTKSLSREDDLDLEQILGEFLSMLIDSCSANKAYIINENQGKIYHSNNIELEEVDTAVTNILKLKIEDWGYLYIDGPNNADNDKFWYEVAGAISLFIHSAELKVRTKLISNLTSEIRRTLRPDLALEKIYNSLKEATGIDGFYFFKRLVNASPEGIYSDPNIEDDETDGEIFKGYSLYFERSSSPKHQIDPDIVDVLQLQEIQDLTFLNPDLEVEIFSSRVRGREWGLLVVCRDEKWTPELVEIYDLFAEQMATVFNQHELHAESLTMAQREFLLNQITTKIRESLVVESIIDTAVQEVGQVMGVESCGILILDRKIKGSIGHRTWSVDDKYSPKMTDAIYASLKTDLEPNWLQPSIQISDTKHFADGPKSYMCCGLFKDNTKELIGVLALGFFEQVRSWTHDEQLLLEGVAKQLEIALMQASIYHESQQTKRQMALLHRMSSDIRDSLDISIVLGQIAKGIGEVLGLNRCFVRRFSDDFTVIKTEEEYCSRGYEPTADMIFGFEREWIQKLLEKSDSLKSIELLNIPSVRNEFHDKNPDLLKIANAIELKSYLSIPLVARGRVLGTINVHQCDRERNFLPEEIEFIFRVGSEAAIAIEHAELFDTINKLSKTDPDTGLLNKKCFREIAEKQIAKCQELGKDISFMLVDVDYLKEINDDSEHGGHLAGDEAIQILATVLSNTVRQTPVDDLNKRISDIVGRFGGDEFMVLLPNTSIDNALKVAERISDNLKNAKHSTWPKPLTCSIGVAGTPHDPYDYEHFKTLADQALYLSKHKGRNRISSTLDFKDD